MANESPYLDENSEMIILPLFRFTDHYLIQEWLNATEQHEKFTLAIAEIPASSRSQHLKSVAALVPVERELQFYAKLRGNKYAEEIQNEILDFQSKNKYNA